MVMLERITGMRVVKNIWISEIPLVLSYAVGIACVMTWWAHVPV
jgi:hypothetical protein